MSKRTNPIIIKWFVLFPNQNFNLFLIWCKTLGPFWLNNILLRIIYQNSIFWKLNEEFDSLKLISSKFNMKLISWRDEFHMNRLILLILRWCFFFLIKKWSTWITSLCKIHLYYWDKCTNKSKEWHHPIFFRIVLAFQGLCLIIKFKS